jgi:hypothetical protein
MSTRLWLIILLFFALSLAISKASVLSSFVFLGTSCFWIVGWERGFEVSKIPLAFVVWVIFTILGGVFGLVRSLWPPEEGEWLFSPINAMLFTMAAVGFYLFLCVGMSCILWSFLDLKKVESQP